MDVDNQPYITGTISLDPYGKKITSDQLNYQQEILDFIELDASQFGLDIISTQDIEDPYKDPVITYLKNHPFYWGWFIDRVSPQVFKKGTTKKVFLYNADYDGGSDITDPNSETWVNTSLLTGEYASTAGATSNPGETAFIYPRPFFECLFRGGGIGEAFLFANKYVNWKMFLVGDPLMVVEFPRQFTEKGVPNKEVIRQIIQDIDNSIKQYDIIITKNDDLMMQFMLDPTFDTMEMYFGFSEWRTRVANVDARNDSLGPAVISITDYIRATENQTINQWLFENNVKVSQSFSEVALSSINTTINENNIYEVGYWQVESTVIHNELTLENINYTLQISNNKDFTDIVYEINSNDNLNWFYEKEQYSYTSLPPEGFPSNYSGRRILYVGNNYPLQENRNYHVRLFSDDSGPSFTSETQEIVT